ncbi:hypothetical protein [Chryseobacterium cucumeris]|uniref:hypothetical protein n=1 Tax=Chryseobacterium cucumeris TaxID=1813611 RepID=UPI00245898BF|nr:hypothetical protein [Chryseobacterium cucumeris]MDH5034010.1 hypothetical protein [Chryseobacterium cucumeris]
MANINSRRVLFEKFSNQLHLLKKEGIINIELKYEKTYICPICLDQFSIDDIISSDTKNFLTEEDAPPDKLGGSRIALTCKRCNSTAGHEIDAHLINRIRMIDNGRFYPGTTHEGTVEFEGKNIQTEITSDGDGKLQLLHRFKNNNPTFLDKFINNINQNVGKFLNLKQKRLKNDSEKVNKALLKTSYILTFAKFGYIFLLDEYYNNIRKEISDTNTAYSGHVFLAEQFNPTQLGTYYILNKNAESIFNVFSLETKYSQTIIGNILPLRKVKPEEIYNHLTVKGYKIGVPDSIGVTLNVSTYDKDADLFNDMEEINRVLNWYKSFHS